MDYKKEYEEAVKRAKAMIKVAEKEDEVYKIAITIFPELKESEDERMWKLIKKYAHCNISDMALDADHITREQLESWLEKQGEQKVNYTASVETGNGGINALVTRELPTSGCDDSNYCSDCTNNKGCINCENGDMKETEHKTEPKFKVRNWYQCTKDFFGKGVTFNKNTAYYCAIEGCLQDEYGCHIAIVKDLYDNFKLWDITKDVKEGDVLIGIYGTFIFMGESNGGYCGVLSDNTFIRGTGNNDMTKGLHPATKEQRDALLKALADAGWEFDFEKKELKGIEQKSVSITDEWIENYWQHEKVINPYSHDKGEEIQFDHKGFVRFCKKYCKKPTAWSEEDERLYRGLQELIYSTPYCNSRKKISDWLKSLKDKIGE